MPKMIVIILFILIHWYAAFFCHGFFQHRYASHRQFEMSIFWERFFFVLTWLSQGTTYLSPTGYAIMHRIHHAHTDKENDPHSPLFLNNFFNLIKQTKKYYLKVLYQPNFVNEKYLKNLPVWKKFDAFAYSKTSRIGWAVFYIIFYVIFSPSLTWYIFLPLHILISPIQGGLINYFGHKDYCFTYRNFNTKDHSKNFMPIDFLFLGEAYHNNHHARPNKLNNGQRNYEIDTIYLIVLLLNIVGILKLKKRFDFTN